MPKIKVPFDNRKMLTPEVVGDMINAAPTLQDKAIIVFYYVFGTRVSEAFTIEKSDMWIHGEWLNINIKHQKQKKSILPKIATLKARTDMNFIHYLIAHWSSVKGGKLFKYGRYDVSTARVKVWKMVKKTNKDAWVHLFRHTRNDAFRRKGYTARQRMEWFGWSNVKAAEKTYAHPSEKEIEQMGGDIE